MKQIIGKIMLGSGVLIVVIMFLRDIFNGWDWKEILSLIGIVTGVVIYVAIALYLMYGG